MTEVLLVSPYEEKARGGIAVWTDSYLKNCSKYGINCTLMNIAMIGKRAVQGNAKRSIMDEIIRTTGIFKRLSKLLKTKEYHCAHLNTSCGEFGLIRDYLTAKIIKKKQPKAKLIVHFHCNIEDQCKTKLSLSFLKKIVSISDKCLVLNEQSKAFLDNGFIIESVVVNNFIASNWIKKDLKNIRHKIEKVIFVGYVQPQKGINEIYEVSRKLPEIKFNLVGEVRDDIRGLSKPDNINLVGAMTKEEIRDMLDDSDLFLFPTHSEGFSLALLESMARGVPAITTDVGSNKAMIEDNGGVIVPINDASSIEKAIRELSSNRELRTKMSVWSVQKVMRSYTEDIVFNGFMNLYCN